MERVASVKVDWWRGYAEVRRWGRMAGLYESYVGLSGSRVFKLFCVMYVRHMQVVLCGVMIMMACGGNLVSYRP
jgi:hypothetical protein